MDFLKNIKFYNSIVTPEDCEKADALRTKWNQRLTSEPVFRNVRATIDAAEKLHPRTLDAAHATVSVQELQREAMSDLRSQLKALRSNNTFQNFNESVPISTKESRIRGSFITDAIHDEKRAPSKTSVNVSASPLNSESSRIRRETFSKETGIELEVQDEGKVDYYGRVTARLRQDVTPEQELKILRLIKCLVPWSEEDAKRVKDELKEKYGDEADKAKAEMEESGIPGREPRGEDYFTDDTLPKSQDFAPRIYTGADGRKYLEMNGAVRDSRKDGFQAVLLKVASAILQDPYLDTAEEERIMNLAPLLFRLAKANVEFPGNVFNDFLNSPTEKSWMSLVEGLRVNFDVILSRQFFEELVLNDITKEMTKSFDKEDLVTKLLSMAGASFFSDLSLQINQAPPEVSFGTLVKEAGHAARRTAEAVDPVRVRGDNDAKNFAEKFLGAGFENVVASFVGSFMHIGLTNEYAKERILMLSSLACLAHNEEGKDLDSILEGQDDWLPYLISLLQETLRNTVEEIQTVNLVGHSVEINAEFVGLNEAAWGFIPTTSQGMVDAAKPVILAHSRDYTLFKEDPPTQVEADMIDFSETHPNRGVFQDKVQEEIDRLWIGQNGSHSDQYHGSMFVAERTKANRNAMFTICVACSNDENDEEWAKLLSLFGVQPLGLKSQRAKKSKKDGDDGENDSDNDDDDDDDDEEILGFPSSTEGYCRSAYVQRKSDGRCFQFVRPVCDSENDIDRNAGITFVHAADAVIVINSLKELTWLSNPSGSVSRYSKLPNLASITSRPTLFVNTKPGAEAPTQKEMDKLNREGQSLYTPSITRGVTFPSSVAEADQLLDWCVQNSANPQRGAPGTQPAQAFDWAIEDPFMLA